MKWVKTKPDKAGAWWYRYKYCSDTPWVTLVLHVGGTNELLALWPGREGSDTLDYLSSWNDAQWSDCPVTEPEE